MLPQEYTLYRGDEVIGIGTAEELAKRLDISPDTIRFYATPTYTKRSRGLKDRLVAVKMHEIRRKVKPTETNPVDLQRASELRKRLRENKIQETDLAKHMGLSQSTINNWKHGYNWISDVRWKQITESIDHLVAHPVQRKSKRIKKRKHLPHTGLVQTWMINSLRNRGNTIAIKDNINGKENLFLEELEVNGFECQLRDTGHGHWVVERRNRSMGPMDEIREIGRLQASQIASTSRPYGKYWTTDGVKYIGIDNATGNAWVEEFDDKETCIAWLKGEYEMSDRLG